MLKSNNILEWFYSVYLRVYSIKNVTRRSTFRAKVHAYIVGKIYAMAFARCTVKRRIEL
jgi:hypothetical protein